MGLNEICGHFSLMEGPNNCQSGLCNGCGGGGESSSTVCFFVCVRRRRRMKKVSGGGDRVIGVGGESFDGFKE